MTTTTTFLPPADLLQETAAALATQAEEAGDKATRRAFDKAAFKLAAGWPIQVAGKDYLIPSNTRGDIVHRVRLVDSTWMCNCEAGSNGKTCYHAAIAETVEQAWEQTEAAQADEFEDAAYAVPF